MKWVPVILLVVIVALVVRYADESVWTDLGGRVAYVAGNLLERDDHDDDDDDDDHPSRLTVVNGHLGLRLTAEEQRSSGLQLTDPIPWSYRHEIKTVAEVRNIIPLLELKAGFEQLESELGMAGIALSHSRQAYNRLALLHADDANISERQVNEAEMQMRSDETKLRAARQALNMQKEKAVQEWGHILIDEMLDEDSSVFAGLQAHQYALLYVPLRHQDRLTQPVDVIHISQDDDRLLAREAQLLAPATDSDPLLQGESFYYTTDIGRLRAGMRLHAWLPGDEPADDGLLLSSSAVIWQGGSPWVYVRHEEDFFYRIAIPDAIRLGRDWFMPAGRIPSGRSIVVSGAQMLLSEEYRWQIPDEDDDP
jgi:hypothetical protein